MLNVVQHLFMEEQLVDNEVANARNAMRAAFDDQCGIGVYVREPDRKTGQGGGSQPGGGGDAADYGPAAGQQEWTEGTPSAPHLPPKAYIPPMQEVSGGASPFPGLGPPVQ